MPVVESRDLSRTRTNTQGQVQDEALLQEMLGSIQDHAIFMLNAYGKVRTWNDTAKKLKGYEADEIIGKHFSLFFTPEDIAAGIPEVELEQARKTGKFENEGWRVRKDGSQFWALVGLSAVYDSLGQITGFCKVTQDITHRKQQEDALRDAKYRLQGIYDSCSHLVGLLDIDGTVVDANRAALQLLEVPPEEVYGKHFSDTPWISHSPELQDRVRKAIEQAAAGQVMNLAADHPMKDGTLVHIDLRITPVFSDDGEVIYLIPEGVDVTERIEQERKIQGYIEELENRNRKLREMSQLIHLSHDAILSWEPGGTIRSWNQGAASLYGYSKQEAIGTRPHELLRAVQTISGEQVEDQVMQQGHWGGRMIHRTKDGEEIEVFSRQQLMHLGETKVILETNRDLREWRQVVDLKGLNEKLKQSNQELEQFAYIASHDLQEPLRKITAYAELIEEDEHTILSSDSKSYLKTVLSGARRLQHLITDLLQYSRITSRGKAFSKVDPGECLRAVIESLELRIKELGAIITYDELPVIHADESQLILLLQNLISNALKYRSDQPPKIHIAAKKTSEGFEFSVKDNGIGIEPQYREQIFEIFKRLHARREREGGTGIGLANCRRIVQRLGGQIWVESTPGEGSTFHFTVKQ
ncbi:PAS domain-containing sensor histidine kinase [Aeoliella mucimassa]|uniref:histidine kinase n=1 Tax=Aeoliella mucimassa TaxID=2527972 RepID=A0A518AHY9_9BACT|nr:PAS domain-containing sensor histidine kinase [Aeoliella mucimassa]QDU54346.1 Phytochrome-like protein cph1 [Aeoliella mucimassa]